ncbi:MAG: hypothetical protein E7435_00865 [Ruminococcaceae bacterium]|nr:hypothetical protein [Oscillospiraceae bacterium]
MKKGFLTTIFVIVMVLAMLPAFAMTASAAETDTWDGTAASQAWESGSGSEATPYVIMTAEQLAKLAADVNGGTTYTNTYFKLGANLDLAGATYNWTPIGGYHTKNQTAATAKANNFAGVLDGNGMTISNLSSTTPAEAYGYNGYRGLFGNLSGTVMNLTLDAPVVSAAYQYVAGLVAYSNGGTVKNITVKNPSIASTKFGSTRYGVSAIIGYMTNGTTVENCHVTGGTISAINPGVGAVAGYLDGTSIKNCTATNVAISYTSSPTRVGSVVGAVVNANVTDCHATGCSITGTYAATSNYGGIVGYAEDASVSDCTVKNASISVGAQNVGGIVGQLKYVDGTNAVTNCFVENSTITSTSAPVAGVVGYSYGNTSNMNTIKNCGVIGGSATGHYNVGGIVGNGFQTKVIGCYNHGMAIVATYNGSTTAAGGIAGYNATCYSCFSSATVTLSNSTSTRFGPIGGDYTTCNYCAYDSDVYNSTKGYTYKGEAFTTEQVKSGEVTYYLSTQGTTNANAFTAWKQTIGNQDYPSLTGKTVYYDAAATPKYFNKVTYTVTVPTATAQGSVSASNIDAVAGEVITLTVTPAENYALTSLTVTDADGNPVAVADNKFTMPAKAVTVAATFAFQKITLTEADFTISGLSTEYNMSVQGVTITNLPDELEGYVTIKYYENSNQLMGAPTNAGAYEVCVQISGSPDYNDVTLTYDMTINPIQLSAGQISVGSVLEEIVYNGSEQKPTVYIDLGGIPFDATAYGGTVTYSNNINAGTATVVISGNFEGTATFEIKKATPIIFADAPLDKVMGGYVMEITPTTSAIDNFLNPTIFTVLDGEGYSVTGNTITIDNGVAIGSTIKVKIQSTETTNYTAAEGELALTVGVPTADTAELEAKIAMLEEKLSKLDETFATDKELSDEIAIIQGEIATLESAIDGYATDAELQTAISRIETLEQKVDALGSIYATKTELNAAVDEIKELIAKKADTDTVNQKLNELLGKITALEEAKDDFKGADATLKRQLESAIATAKSEAISAAETLVNDAKTELQTAIDKKADTTTLNAKVQELKTAIETAEAAAKAYADTKDTALKQQFETAIANAKQEAIDAADNALTQAKTELNAAIAKKADITALEKAISDLEAAITLAQTTAQNFATDADAALKLALEAEIKAAKTELNDAISELESRVKANEDKIAEIKKNLEEAVEKLNKADTENAEELAKAVEKLDKAIDEAKAAAVSSDKALEAKIAAAEKKLDEKIAQVQGNLDKATAELDAAIKSGDKDLADKIAALQSELASTKELLEKADAKNNAELVAKFENADKVLDAAVKAVQKNLDDAKAELEKAIADGDTALEGKISDLNTALTAAKTALESADAADKAELTAKISENYKTLDAAVKTVQKNLDDAKAELDKAIADGDTALESKISELNTALAAAKAALETADAENKAELETKVDALNATLDAAIKAVQKNLDNTKAELKKAIKSGDAALEAKIADLNEALKAAKVALEAADAANKAELNSKIEEAYNTLEATIKAVQNELEAVKAELEAKDRALEAKTDELQTVLIIVAIVSGVTLCGGVAFVIWFFIDRKKKV